VCQLLPAEAPMQLACAAPTSEVVAEFRHSNYLACSITLKPVESFVLMYSSLKITVQYSASQADKMLSNKTLGN